MNYLLYKQIKQRIPTVNLKASSSRVEFHKKKVSKLEFPIIEVIVKMY